MNASLRSLVIALGFAVAAPVVVHAEAPKVEHIINLLQQARESDQPVPQLQQAHAILKKFDPKPSGLKATAAGIGAKRQAANGVAAIEHKKKAMEAINAAIETAQQGGDAKSKIDHAIAMVHQAGSLKD